MGKPPKGKVGIYAYVDKKVVEEFKKLTKAKYSGMRGLSMEVEDAMRAWISQHTQNHTNPKNPSKPLTHQVIDQVIFKLREMGYIYQCTLRDLKKAISDVRGSDERTIRKWINILLRERRVKQLNSFVYEIM